ncbi:MAG: TIGR00282 family metallophosphoesterase [Oscillospiraceae bacterium]|nr:TIGR00282 family metallophosphoesterase [Oscillospiraceae bacterium]
MKLLFLGDIVGQRACEFVALKLRTLKASRGLDIVVANGENSANGNGITPSSAKYLFNHGVDIITTGNHCYRRKEIYEMMDSEERLLRPANFPEGNFGHGFCIYDMGSCQIAVVNLMGTAYLEAIDNPFAVIDKVLCKINTPNIFVDFHAEATSEKKAMGYFLQGRVTAVFGTHTHVQTADETILFGHTGYITDVGMCGPEHSVLGVKTELAIEKQRFHSPVKFLESDSPCFINGVLVEFDQKNGKCVAIERVIIR